MGDSKDIAHKTVAELFDMLKEKQYTVDALSEISHEKDLEIADLKAQLNNMEQCYIEKKKRVDELEGALNEVKDWKSHPVGHETSFGSWGVRDFYRGLAEKALRGES